MAKRELRGCVAIITGASSGIGWQSAVRLAEQGVRVCVTARRKEPLEKLSEQIRELGGQCLVVPGDVTRPDDIQHVVNACLRYYGRIDLLVNNAAVQVYGRFEQYDWEEIEQVFRTNCFGYMRFARAVLPHFHEQRSGHVINVLSVLSLGSLQLFSIYSATKAALFAWAKCLALELAGSGIHVSNALMPAIASPLYDHVESKTGQAYKPLPPIYKTDLAARAIVKLARKPNEKLIPVFLQGKLLLWSKDWAPPIRKFVLRHWGESWQKRDLLREPNRGNLFAPLQEGFGPNGTLRPTPGWKRYSAAALVVGAGLGFGGALMLSGIRRLRKFDKSSGIS